MRKMKSIKSFILESTFKNDINSLIEFLKIGSYQMKCKDAHGNFVYILGTVNPDKDYYGCANTIFGVIEDDNKFIPNVYNEKGVSSDNISDNEAWRDIYKNEDDTLFKGFDKTFIDSLPQLGPAAKISDKIWSFNDVIN